MRKILLAGALLIASLATGCTVVHSAIPGASTATGEVWYTKTTIFIIPVANDIVYCDGKSNVCKRAEIR